jgi:hypothetical protein
MLNKTKQLLYHSPSCECNSSSASQKKYAFHKTQMCITLFTKPYHCSIIRAILIQSKIFNPI